MNLLLWQVIAVACFAKLVSCGVMKSPFENTVAAVNAKVSKDEEKFHACPPKNSKFPVYLPDPDDCTRFFICDNGVPHAKKCFPGLHFNTKINACDFPKNAKCDTNADDETKGRINEDGVGECPKENSRFPVYLPHPEDCGKFYVCDNGSPHLKSCLPGLHFNPKVNACDFPKNAGCDKDTPKGKVRDDSSGMCRSEDSSFPEYFPHPEDCNKFYICRQGTEILQKCPTGLHFNPKFNVCDYPQEAECEAGDSEVQKGMPSDGAYFFSCPEKESSDATTRHPHPTDCHKFYECDRGKPTLKNCNPGLNFNEEIHACDQADNAICDKGMTLAFAGVRSPFCPSLDGKLPIFFRHPTNCTIYYMCGNGLAYEFVCPARLHFNLRRRMCDYEENSRCKT